MKIKYLGKLMPLALAALLLVSCSNEDSVKNEQAAVNTSLFAKSPQDFTKLLDNLYGTKYKLGTGKVVTDVDANYIVTEVTLSGVAKPIGYVVETPNEQYYYEYSATNGTATEYTTASFSPVGIYDLKNDPNYNPITFDPYTPPKNGVKKFWGSDGPRPSDNLYKDKDHPGHCYRKSTVVYYVFWAIVSITESEDHNARVPAECNSSSIDDPNDM
jgi:hypothetical protein